jgi:hypothetical protein
MLSFQIPNMTCGHCVRAVTQAVQLADPAATVQADLATHQVQVDTTASRDPWLRSWPGRLPARLSADRPAHTDGIAPLETLGRYRLVRVLGRGAMGVVYEALDERLGRTVAIKTVLRSHLDNESTAQDYAARFVREAQAAARLSHPNIVTVYDFGEHDDLSYIVMEFVSGRELADLFRSGHRFTLLAGAADHGRAAGRAGLRPCPGRGAPRRQAGQCAGGSGGPCQAGRLWRGPHEQRQRRTAPCPAPWWARPTTCRPSRSWGSRWARAPTSSPLAWCSTSSSPAASLLKAVACSSCSAASCRKSPPHLPRSLRAAAGAGPHRGAGPGQTAGRPLRDGGRLCPGPASAGRRLPADTGRCRPRQAPPARRAVPRSICNWTCLAPAVASPAPQSWVSPQPHRQPT